MFVTSSIASRAENAQTAMCWWAIGRHSRLTLETSRTSKDAGLSWTSSAKRFAKGRASFFLVEELHLTICTSLGLRGQLCCKCGFHTGHKYSQSLSGEPSMNARILNTEELAQLRRVDSPTVANVIELLDIRSYVAGYTNLTLKAIYPKLPPAVGYAVTATFRA